jgi:hypothetical protein
LKLTIEAIEYLQKEKINQKYNEISDCCIEETNWKLEIEAL